MKILFLHPNMPGQYKHLCLAFARNPENQVVFITKPKKIEIPGVYKVEYDTPRETSLLVHRYLLGTEKAVLQGQEVWRVCRKLKQEEGFVPDIICAHPGWGDALYVKDIYPDTPLLSFFEFYYRSSGSDVGFDLENSPVREDDIARVRTKNVTNLLSLEAADWGISPTHWQFEQHPPEFRNKISVLHDGVDTDIARPNHDVVINTKEGETVKYGDEVVTYIARNFEPYRGFPTFMKAAKILLDERPNLKIVAVGADDVSYGRPAPRGTTYRRMYLDKVKPDLSRLYFTGILPYAQLLQLLQVSAAHIYLTYPFVLSWSMLEAMSCEALVIGSKTAPVEEVIEDGVNGLLVDFFSPEDLAARVIEALEHKEQMQEIRKAARRTVEDRFALSKLLPLHMGLITDIADRKNPPPTAAKIERLYDNHNNAKIAS